MRKNKFAEQRNSCIIRSMKTQTIIDKLGGGYAGREALAALFTEHGYPCTTKNTYRWTDANGTGHLPEIREWQLRKIKPGWFRKARK
jgi:hypothetical protein